MACFCRRRTASLERTLLKGSVGIYQPAYKYKLKTHFIDKINVKPIKKMRLCPNILTEELLCRKNTFGALSWMSGYKYILQHNSNDYTYK